jgi:hypothetical protein
VSVINNDPYNPYSMLGLGFALNGISLGIWYGLRGRFMHPTIQKATIALAFVSVLATTLNNTPHMYDMRMAYQQLLGDNPNVWQDRRVALLDMANANRISLDRLINDYCRAAPERPWDNLTSWQKIRLSFMPI